MKRVFLKKLSFDELDTNYINWLNDKEVCKYNGHGETLYTREMAEKFIADLENDSSQEVFAVYLNETNEHIGNIALQRIDLKNKKAELAYIFGEKQYWGKGFATEASQLLIDYACKKYDLHRLTIGTRIDNIGMQKVSEKLGFKKEGQLKDYVIKNGQFYDWLFYGKIL